MGSPGVIGSWQSGAGNGESRVFYGCLPILDFRLWAIFSWHPTPCALCLCLSPCFTPASKLKAGHRWPACLYW